MACLAWLATRHSVGRTSWKISVFNYATKEHTVTEVSKKDYYACSGNNALSNDDGGLTNVTLTAPGTRYFICNVTVHCTIGMKLAVTVAGGDSPSTPPGATPTGAGAGSPVLAMGSVVAAAAAGALIKLALH